MQIFHDESVQCFSILLTYVMSTLEPIDAPWQHKESLLIEKVHLFLKIIAINKDFFVLLTIASMDMIYCSFAHSLQCMQDINSYKDENFSTIVGRLLVLVWAC